MTLHALEGHERLTGAIARAFQKSELPTVLLLHGPRGVGKQRLALWAGQLLVCDVEVASGPCGECRGCRMSLRLEHPDLLWYFPIKRPPSKGSRERDQQAHEAIRTETISQLQENPLKPAPLEDTLGIHLGTVRNLKKEAMRRPGMAPRRVFIVGEAQELVSQEASPEAANALLKVLEEPPPDFWFLLTSSEPERLLPTIRSRTTGIHVPPLGDETVRVFLSEHTSASADEVQKATNLSEGSIGRAICYLPSDGELGPLERIRQEAFHLLRGAISSHPADRFTRALSYPPAGARGLQELLSSLESWLRDLAVVASSEGAAILNPDAGAWLKKTVTEAPIEPVKVTECMECVEEARSLAAGNVNPQLILGNLLTDLHLRLTSRSPAVAEEVS